jgi:CheY-like chemotaxis protein
LSRSFQGCRVLLVEDNPINRFVVEEMLRRLGCRDHRRRRRGASRCGTPKGASTSC